MKYTLLLAGLLLAATLCPAQQKAKLPGQWWLVALDAGLYHDYRNDSTAIPHSFTDKMRGEKDSAFIIGLLTGLANSYKNFQYNFLANGTYTELRGQKQSASWTYTTSGTNTIVLNRTNQNGRQRADTLLYEFHGQQLWLKDPSDKRPIRMIFERSEVAHK